VRYLAAARYDDLLTLRTWVAEAKSRQVRFAYELRGEKGPLLRGETVHLCLSHGGTVVALPADLRRLLSHAASSEAVATD